MKRFVTVLLTVLLPLWAAGQDYAALDTKMDAYFAAIEAASVTDKCKEMDFLVLSAEQTAVREHIARYAFAHYRDSRLMGDEGVAVYVAKKWLPEDAEARSYVLFNGHSLLGMKAPPLTLTDHNGQKVSLFQDAREHYTLLYFYDTSCTSCTAESQLLMHYIPTAPVPLDVVAVYVGTDEKAWARYRATRFHPEGALHLWDPAMESSFQQDYGVLKTPMLYLIAPDGTIAGRRLDTSSLATLLDALTQTQAYRYGGEESMALFDTMFAEGASKDDILETAGYIADRTADNPAGYAHMMGDLLYYLSLHRGESLRAALGPFMANYIYGKDVWSAEDSLQVFPIADMMRGLLDKCRVGTRVPNVRLKGTLLRPGKADKTVSRRLRCLRGRPGFVVFVSDSCATCLESEPAIRALAGADAPRGTKVFLVQADDNLLDDFDLSYLPYVLELDRRGRIVRRYVDF